MASKDLKTTFTCDLFNIQMDELKQMKMNVEQLRNELTMAQIKYHQRLSDYEAKLEQLHCQAEKVQKEQVEKETNLQNDSAEWRDIKSRLESSAVSANEKVKLNVGGAYFETTIETLTKHSEGKTTYFKALFSRQWQLEKDPKDDSIFINRSGDLFWCILQYLLTEQLITDEKDTTLRQNLIIEAEFYKIERLVSLLKLNKTISQNYNIEQRQLYSGSEILSSERQEQLNKLYGINNQRWRLIFRASRDGFSAQAFHKCCDGSGPTMTVIRSLNGYIFGGFATVPWSSSGHDKSDASAFLFTLKNPHHIKPTKYLIYEHSVRFAVSHRKSNGPTFGSTSIGGSDIYIRDPFTAADCRIFFPRTYVDTTCKGSKTFTGDSHFSCTNVEVFLLISE